MTLQSSGTITMAEINSEFSLGNNLNAYRGTTWWKDDASTGTFSSGAIAFSDFYSTRVSAPGYPGNDSYTKLLLHMDGSNGSTTFTDSCAGATPHTMTASGGAQISTAQSKFGAASGYFDGTGDYVSTPDSNDWSLGSGDFTVDGWFYFTGTGTRTIIMHGSSVAAFAFTIYVENSTFKVVAKVTTNGSYLSATTVTSSSGISQNTWNHVAFVRTGNTLKLFVNGTQTGGDVTFSSSVWNSTTTLLIGNGYSAVWQGYLDEIRISVGIARWTANFTPPTLAYI